MEAIIKVERLWMDNKLHRAGEMLDISEERIMQLGTSVERVAPTIETIDERDAQIGVLKAKVEELEIALVVASTGGEMSTPSDQEDAVELPTADWTATKIKRYLDDVGIEYGIRMSKTELLEIVNSMEAN